MRAYFDTSALIPLLIDEPGTDAAGHAWDNAERLVSARLIYVEARAALAFASRVGRISAEHARRSAGELDGLLAQIDYVDVDEGLVRRAGDLAERHGLRGYDAVHLAAVLSVQQPNLVFVCGDGALLAAAEAEGLVTVPTV